MITIKTGSYTNDEIKTLAKLFEGLEQAMLDLHCPDNGKCTVCPYRHICEDIHVANVFINERANK